MALALASCSASTAWGVTLPPRAGAAASPRQAAAEVWAYRVQRGDNLIGIADRLLDRPQDWRRLQRVNRIEVPRRLQAGSELRIPVAWLRAETAEVRIVQPVGQVTLQSTQGGSSEVRDGTPLRAQETLVTGADSSALLRFVDGSQLRVSPASRITLEQAQVLRGSGQAVQVMRLQQGEVESQVRREPPRPRFEIRSPVLRLGARGTEFRATFDAPSLTGQGAVDQGRVQAWAGSAGNQQPGTLLADGFGIVATGQGLSRPVELLPAAPLPGGPVTIERLPVRLRWSALTGAALPGSAWLAQVLAAGAGDGPQPAAPLLVERRGVEPEVDLGSLADGSYRLRLRVVDAQGLAGRESTLGLVVAARPEPPFLSAPAQGGVLEGDRARLVWLRSAAAARYRLQIAPSSDFGNPVHDLRDLEGPEAQLELAPGHWFWRLASVRSDGHTGPWSDVQAFEQRPPPPPSAPSAPESKTEADGSLRVRTSAGKPGDRYEFQLVQLKDGVADFARPLLERQSDQPELRLEGLDAGGYQLRARIVDARGVAGPWGASGSFDVPRANTWWWAPALLLLLLL